ncbi:flagellin [Geodermatophilus sp. DSM 44513]|uniref:flagellin N-terminal helical domain-containing protein n=1 Tax=Geodermatophilus sp. DSM 44513 TaxID=1528104 RepID=UPI0014130CBF|nr:flagellin [Geodermatophilus sp. DSM 44513]WNV76649.1 flagellin [Geodermatophilus sp. DSM 44513]
MSVATSVASLGVRRALSRADAEVTSSLERLSSGLRIVRAADDAAGLAIAEGLRAQVGGTTRALRNTWDGVNVLRTADGALDGTAAVLRRMRDLTVQAGNTGSLDDRAIGAVRTEFEQLGQELDRIAGSTAFNGIPLLDGTYDRFFQVGADAGDTVRAVIRTPGGGVDRAGLGLSTIALGARPGVPHTLTRAVSDAEGTPSAGRLSLAGDYASAGTVAASYRALIGTITYGGRSFDLESVDYSGAVTAQDHVDRVNAAAVAALGTTFTPFIATPGELVFGGETPGAGSTAADAEALTPTYTAAVGTDGALGDIDVAIDRVSSLRAYLGAMDNRFTHTISRLGVSVENTAAAELRIRDADVAAETARLARSQVLAQVGTAMLAQANQRPRSLLSLLG